MPDVVQRYGYGGNFFSPADGGGTDPSWADITLTYPALQPEADGELISAYRTGRPVRFIQDISGMMTDDTNNLNQVFQNAYPATRQSADMILANIFNSPNIEGK